MIATNNKILVSCDVNQKEFILVGDSVFKMANLYEKNYRIKSPTIARVIEGNEKVHEGDILLCHHNLFYLPSPHHLHGDLFSVPFGKVLFAKILLDGSLLPICGNLLGSRIEKTYYMSVTPDEMESYNDRLLISDSGYTNYKKGQTIFARPSSCYDIIYHWNNEQKMVTKISEDMICGVSK